MKVSRKILKMKDRGEKHYTAKDRIFDLPFKLIIIGRSQLAGKTNLLGNLLLRKEYYLNDFKGENMKTFALILFFGCAGLLIISATVQILYAVF